MTTDQRHRRWVWTGSLAVWVAVAAWESFGRPNPEWAAWLWVVIFAAATIVTSFNWVDAFRTWRKNKNSLLEERRNISWNFVVRESILWGISVALMLVGIASLYHVSTFILTGFFGAAILIFDASAISRIQRRRLKYLAGRRAEDVAEEGEF